MIRRLSILPVAFFFSALLCFPRIPDKHEELRSLVRKYGQAEISMAYPGREGIDHLSKNVSVRSVKDKNVSIIISPVTLDWFLSQGFEYSIVQTKSSEDLIAPSNLQQALYWDTYPTYSQYDSIMRLFVSEYPSLCRLDTIGTTIRGKLVLALKISGNCQTGEDEPKVFYTSSMHGDETGGFILMLRLSEYLLKNYNSSERIRNLVDKLEIWINPLANPDGAYYGGDKIELPVRGNANGYDLNRNFPDPGSPGEELQKETLDMMKFMAKHRFTLSANFHSGTEVVNYPWDHWIRDHADKNWFYRVSRSYADTVHVYSPTGYMDFLDDGVTNGYRWYPVYGSRQDYMTYELQGRELTIELDEDFITPVDELNELWESNRRSLLDYLESALFGIHGHVFDSSTGDPVPARIFISGHDKDNSHVYSDTLTGRFVRLIEPGSWDLTFTADGYRDLIIHDVSAASGKATELNVAMTPDTNPVDTAGHTLLFLYPNPVSETLNALIPGEISGKINICIFSVAGRILSDYDTRSVEGAPVIIDVSGLAAGTYLIRFTGRSSGISFSSRFIVVRESL